jgi:hypothetical protein
MCIIAACASVAGFYAGFMFVQPAIGIRDVVKIAVLRP